MKIAMCSGLIPVWIARGTALVVMLVSAGTGWAAEPSRIEKKGPEFSAVRLLNEKARDEVRKSGYLHGGGEADYALTIPATGWYELWIEAAGWSTDLFLDGKFLIHTPFVSEVWKPQGKAEKVMNLYLPQGAHTLTFSRPWHPGLPWMSRFYLEPAKDVTGMVRVTPVKDYLTFRKGEDFPLKLSVGRSAKRQELIFQITRTEDGGTEREIKLRVDAGQGNLDERIDIPTDREGVFDLKILDAEGKPVDRTIQYLVVDTSGKVKFPEKLEKKLVQEIDCAAQKPDYEYGGTTVIKAVIGAYRQSGPKGVNQAHANADSFAYILTLPSIQEFYLVEADCPDDDLRFFTIYLVDPNGFGFPPAPGVVSGGPYPLSNKLQTRQMVFVPRDKNPRVIFTPWETGMPAAVSRIRVYRLGQELPTLSTARSERQFGLGTEEAYRDPHFFGAMPTGNNFLTLAKATEKKARWTAFVGATQWRQAIGIYGNTLWPSKILWRDAMGDNSTAIAGPTTTKEPLKKDLIRMMLLYGEKYGFGLVGELNLDCLPYYEDAIALKAAGERPGDAREKPWLLVSKDGKSGESSPHLPYFNPLYPGVQELVASIFQEIAERYKDSPAFDGLAVRISGWCNKSWHTFPSINWGYDDYTVGLFEKETGIRIPPFVDVAPDAKAAGKPMAGDDPRRFSRRYDWLMANAYDQWVDWRCRKIHQYWQRLYGILKSAKPDLKLYMEMSPCTDSQLLTRASMFDVMDQRGWLTLVKESGVDPALYRQEPGIVLQSGRIYPAGFAASRRDDPDFFSRLYAERDQDFDARPLLEFSKDRDRGIVSSLELGQCSFETYPLFKAYGMEGAGNYGSEKGAFAVSGSISPIGRNYLQIYAFMMADGNLVAGDDFQRGVLMDQYESKREFMAEYRSLPAIGMQKLEGTDDPVAVWYGKKEGFRLKLWGGKTYFYLVNRAYYPVEARLAFDGNAQVFRLSTGAKAELEGDHTLKVSLKPYQLLAYVNEGGGSLTRLACPVPEEIKKELSEQIAFVEKLMENRSPSVTFLPISPVELAKAAQKLTEAKAAYAAGRCVTARILLSHHFLVKLYEAFKAWPPNLWQSKLPEIPQGALLPKELKERSDGKADQSWVTDLGEIASSLAGEQALTWNGSALPVGVDVPLRNRYRLSYAYLEQAPYARPTLDMDGEIIPGQDRLSTATQLWGEKAIAEPIALMAGKHVITASAPPGKKGSLFFIKVQPFYRYITANQWNVAGPFASREQWNKPGTGMDTALPPDGKIDLAGKYEGDAGKPLSWQIPELEGDYVDLHKITGTYAMRVSYAVTCIQSPDERPAELDFGVDYWARIWLNEEKVFEIVEAHGYPVREQFKIPIKLKKGRNELKIKVHGGSAGNGFWIAISDPGDLKISPLPQDATATRTGG